MNEPFSITGTPTGFQDAEVTLTGYFQYDWDVNGQHLLSHSVTIELLSRDKYAADTGVTYNYTAKTLDLSEIKQFEGPWPEGNRFRDTLALKVSIFVTYNDQERGNITEELVSQEKNEEGTAYYEAIP